MVHFRRLLVALVVATAWLATVAAPASAGDGNKDNSGRHGEGRHPSLVGTIHGAGGAVMDAASPLKGTTTYSIDAKLFSDGSATGFFDCADLAGSTAEGDIFGPITSWKKVDGKIALSGTAELWNLGRTVRLDPRNLNYTVTIQKFGGAGVGHWTLDVPAYQKPTDPPLCSELLTSGHLVGKGKLFRQRDDE